MPGQQITWDDPKPSGAPQINWDEQQPKKPFFRNLLTHTIGIPDDVLDHPNKWLNPFSREHWSPEHQREMESAFPGPQMTTGAAAFAPDFARAAYRDAKDRNWGGAIGDLVGPAFQVASMARAPKTNLGVEAPNVYEGPVPEEIPAARPVSGGGKLSNVLPLLKREITGKIPLASRFESTKAPTFSEYVDALHGNAKPPEEVPVYGNASHAEIRGQYEPYQGDLTVKPAETSPAAPYEPAPSPYRLRGNQIQDAVTATPRRLIGPERQLPPGPLEPPAAAPAFNRQTGGSKAFFNQPVKTEEAPVSSPNATYLRSDITSRTQRPKASGPDYLRDLKEWDFTRRVNDEMNAQADSPEEAATNAWIKAHDWQGAGAKPKGAPPKTEYAPAQITVHPEPRPGTIVGEPRTGIAPTPEGPTDMFLRGINKQVVPVQSPDDLSDLLQRSINMVKAKKSASAAAGGDD